MLVVLCAYACNAWSQSAYPVKLVRIVNPVAPGGNQEIVARAFAEQMARTLGQQVLVESRPGSAATIGTRYVKSQPADGYTILSVSNTFARVPTLQMDAGYDLLRDFVPVSQTVDVPHLRVRRGR